jgi:hypothetical protein
MKIIYVADDGASFEDEFKCMDYEFILNHPHLKDVHIYAEYGVERENLLSDETYFCADTVIVSTQDALNDLHSLAEYMGHLSYGDINSIGRWVFNHRQETFVKVN